MPHAVLRSSVLVLALVGGAGLGAADWPQFRGPNGSGVGEGSEYAVEFGPGNNELWRAAIPYGQSSPVVAAGRLYLTATEGGQLLTLCLDAETGEELWRRAIEQTRRQDMYEANDAASPTPAADEEGVVSFFADFGLVAYDTKGEQQWSVPLGPFKNFYGMAASPILADGAVILVCDQQTGSFVLAVDRRTGQRKWRTERKTATVAWTTPVVHRPAEGPAQLIVLGTNLLAGYYLSTGEPRWWMPIASDGANGTPVTDGEAIFVNTTGSSEPMLSTFDKAVASYDRDGDGEISSVEFEPDPMGAHFGWLDADENGRISRGEWDYARNLAFGEYGSIAFRPGDKEGQVRPDAVDWRFQRSLSYVPAPILYDGIYYMVKNGGIVSALDAETGDLLKQGRTREAMGGYFASPVAVDGKIYLADRDGMVSVLRAGDDWEILAVNDLGGEVHATPALSDGAVYIRTKETLYGFGAGR